MINDVCGRIEIRGAALATIAGAAHFMMATHASEVVRLIAQHVHRAKQYQIVSPQRDICLY